MAADDDGLWVVCEESQEVVRIDPRSNRAGPPVEVGLEPRFVTVAFGSAWVSNYVDSTLSRIDLGTGEVVAEIATEFGPQVMVEAGDGLWVSSVDTDTVQRIDAATNEPDPPITTEALPDGLLAHAGALWVATDLGPTSATRRSRGWEDHEHLGGLRPGRDQWNQLWSRRAGRSGSP